MHGLTFLLLLLQQKATMYPIPIIHVLLSGLVHISGIAKREQARYGQTSAKPGKLQLMGMCRGTGMYLQRHRFKS